MAVYVDSLMACVPTGAWKWHQSCHMVADSLDELHRFAGRLGLKRCWFQSGATRSGWVPHYDLNPMRRERAVQLGVVEVDRRQAVEIFQRWRSATRSKPDTDSILVTEGVAT